MTADAKKVFDDPNAAINLLVGRGFVEAAFARWTLGDRVYGGQKGGRFLKRLEAPPPEIWEIRITEPIVQGRLFCRFAAIDTLVVTNLHTRQMLGKKGSQPWKQACADCVSAWQHYFPEHQPHTGPDAHAYVSENCDDFPI